MNQEKIGRFIAEIRTSKKMTQKELADKINVTPQAIGNWENGRRLPDYSIIKDLCNELGITINEFFSGEKIKKNETESQFEKNILDMFRLSTIRNEKYKWIVILISITLVLSISFLGKMILIKRGYLMNPNLAYSQRYEKEKENLKGNVNYNAFESISMDFEIGANQYGYAVFKNPSKALQRLKKNYSKGLKALQREFHLFPLMMFHFREYGIYGWQLNEATEEEKEQGRFISKFFDIYENSFN
ncbi:MAG: helix-turn-helix transcriptional regulator [Bacilli bacterium]|nr:helix-turn-helix transcriptional regulator [Bacilli bacterium]